MDLNLKEVTLEDLTVNYLEKTYRDNVKNVKEVALKEINSIEMVIPELNRICIQDKADIIKLMTSLRRRFSLFVLDVKPAIVTIAIVIDTVTCLLSNSFFYTSFLFNNTRIFDLMIQLMEIVSHKLQVCSGSSEDFNRQQKQSLITILELSAKRIENETKYYGDMLVIINTIKCLPESNFDKMKHHAVNVNNNSQQNYKNTISNTKKDHHSPKKNLKQNKISNNNNNNDENDHSVENIIKQIQAPEKVVKKMRLEFTKSEQTPNENTRNAFELMMKTAKSRKKLI